jgi:hypothetical protein
MKKLFFTLALTVIAHFSFSQTEQFRVDFNLVAFYDMDTEEWSEWQLGENTFVLNFNDNNDIAHYKPDGDVAYYRNLGGLEIGYTKNGDRYQIVNALDEVGYEISFQLFDDNTIGAKLIWANFTVQFSYYE